MKTSRITDQRHAENIIYIQTDQTEARLVSEILYPIRQNVRSLVVTISTDLATYFEL